MKNFNFLSIVNNILPMVLMAVVFTMTSCSDDDDIVSPQPPPTPTSNAAAYITDDAKLEMIHSLTDLDGTGRLYEMNYTADYKLDEALSAHPVNVRDLSMFIALNLYDVLPTQSAKMDFGTGCSAFAVPDAANGNLLMGRNFDFRHKNSTNDGYQAIAAILVRTSPKGGKKSISMVDSYWLNGLSSGFYNDGVSDLSILMGAPYVLLDGINEDGFSIGVLALDGKPTKQQRGKTPICLTVAMRMLLDRASTIDEAVKMLDNYDMDMATMGQKEGNYHLFMADATGKYAIVEYVPEAGSDVPSVMRVMMTSDTDRYTTNFYNAPDMDASPHGRVYSDHGKWRYDTLAVNLKASNYRLTESDAMTLLSKVAQAPSTDPKNITSQTQWSAVYNLTEKSLKLSILREYGKVYNFKVNER